MNDPVLRAAVLAGAAIGVVNILFAGFRYSFGTLPVWFYLSQLLLIPAMFYTLPMFRRAMVTPDFLTRAGRYALGWAPPYLVYSLSGELLLPDVNPVTALLNALLLLAVFAVVFAAIRRPQR